jgi:hypothetical protein
MADDVHPFLSANPLRAAIRLKPHPLLDYPFAGVGSSTVGVEEV